jgi:hypothetical protein
MLSSNLGHKIIDMKAIVEVLKKTLGTEEEPVEEVPIAAVHKYILSMIENDKKSGRREVYVFDGYINKSPEEFIGLLGEIGPPDYVINCTCDEKILKDRWKKKNETEEISEE